MSKLKSRSGSDLDRLLCSNHDSSSRHSARFSVFRVQRNHIAEAQKPVQMHTLVHLGQLVPVQGGRVLV